MKMEERAEADAPCLHGYGEPFDLPYSVELWDDNDSPVEELIAVTGDYRVARVLRSRRPSSDGQDAS
jgi:hypothetical protein